MQISNTPSTVYDSKYDILKLIMSVMVVAIHTGIYPQILYPWLRIAVPLFFIISAYFLFSKLQNVSEYDQWKIAKNYASRNIRLYIFWSLVLTPLTLYLRRNSYFSQNLWHGFGLFMWDVLIGSGFGASWYIPASVIGTLIIWWLSKRITPIFVGFISLMSFCFVTILSSYGSIFQNYPVVINGMQTYIDIFGNPVLSFPASLLWIFMGKCFAEGKIRNLSWSVSLLALCLSSVALYLEWQYVQQLDGSFNNDSYFMLLPVCISFFCVFRKIAPISYRYSSYIRQMSTVIYVTHVSLMMPIGFISREILHINSQIILFFTVLPCCILVYFAIKTTQVRYRTHKIVGLLKYAY